jgi:hypothetical protein
MIQLPIVEELFNFKEVMAIPVAAIGAIAGLASAGINAYMSYRDRRRAENALAAMGPRGKLTVPKEVLGAYQERMRRSKMYQGFSQAELNQMRSAQARQNATMFNRAAGIGASPMALQAMAANTDARNWSNVAAQNAAMNRQGQRADLEAADQLAGAIGRYDFASQQDTMGYRDLTERTLGESISRSRQNTADMISGVGGLGMGMAVQPKLWEQKLFA